MASARPLRDVFADLAGDEAARHADPAQLLRDSGHPDLPEALVSEAVISFADTAPVEVAEHLAPYVAANSPVPAIEADDAPDMAASGWVEALVTAPDVADLDSPDPADGLDGAVAPSVTEAQPTTADEPGSFDDIDFGADLGADSGADLGADFGSGTGGGDVDLLDGLAETSYAEGTVTDVPDVAVEAVRAADDTGDDSVWDEDAYDEPADHGEGPDLT
jgi:hypothetical protein